FVTAFLIAVGAWQGTLLRRTVVSAEDTAQKQLRAYVCIEDVFFDLKDRLRPQSGYTNDLRLRFKNYGQTPATVISIAWGHEYSLEVEPFLEFLPDFGQMILPPGARFGRPMGAIHGYGHKGDGFFIYGM